MHERQWKATWYDRNLNRHEYIFYAPDNRVVAGIDFRLKLMDQGRPGGSAGGTEPRRGGTQGATMMRIEPRWWRARWRAGGVTHFYVFQGYESILSTRAALHFGLLYLGYAIPRQYCLEMLEGGWL